jgi:hypothetical protein
VARGWWQTRHSTVRHCNRFLLTPATIIRKLTPTTATGAEIDEVATKLIMHAS